LSLRRKLAGADRVELERQQAYCLGTFGGIDEILAADHDASFDEVPFTASLTGIALHALHFHVARRHLRIGRFEQRRGIALIDEVECHLRGRANQLPQSIGVVIARHLDQNAVAPLPLDRRFLNALGIDAAAYNLD
jgi:hypothetical protein